MQLIKFFVFIFLSKNIYADFLPSSFSANFVQSYFSSIKSEVKSGDGKIDYQYPGKIRFETFKPTHVLFISNGQKSWYYTFPFIDGEEGELTESNGKDSSGFITKFFDSLKFGLKNNELYNVVKKDSSVLILFKDKAIKELKIKEASIKFKTSNLEFLSLDSITLVFLDDKKSTISLKEMTSKTNFDVKKFEFSRPK
jgi:outer membrane lipoprotein-sorting protein